MSDEPGRVIIVEGSISAGKTSLLRSIERYANDVIPNAAKVVIVTERPCKSLLDWFLERQNTTGESTGRAMAFQVIMARDRVETMRNAISAAKAGQWVFIDRGLPGDITFAALQHDKGNITEQEMGVYFDLLEHGVPTLIPRKVVDELSPSPCAPLSSAPDAFGCSLGDVRVDIVYLRTKPEVAYTRLIARGIQSELDAYTMGYFEKLCKKYDRVIDLFEKNWTHGDVVTLDYNDKLSMTESWDGTHAGSVLSLSALRKVTSRFL